MNTYIKLCWPEIMYSSHQYSISSYYKTGLKDDYSWTQIPLE